MWLKIVYTENSIPEWWSKEPSKIEVSIENDIIAPTEDSKSYRLSPIFPLDARDVIEPLKNTSVYFFNFSNAYRILGQIQQLGSAALKKSIYFSNGLSSVILITPDKNLLNELREIVDHPEDAFEEWVIVDSLITNIDYKFTPQNAVAVPEIQILDYSVLDLTERAMIRSTGY